MKVLLYLLLSVSLWGCSSQAFYVGTYTDGDSEGIYKYRLEKDGSLKQVGLAAQSVNPSFLALSSDQKYLFAVNEVEENGSGWVEAYRIKGNRLNLMNRSLSGGAHPCFVDVSPNGYVLAANYSGGNVGLLKLSRDGRLSPLLDVQQHEGNGIHERQAAPHAHSAWFSPWEKQIIAVDLGTNQLWFSHLDKAFDQLNPSASPTLDMEPGAGPRHLAFHPSQPWIYVVNELNCTVSLVKEASDGVYQLDSSISTLPAEFDQRNTCADIKVSPDGRFVYASNRGHNSIAIFEVQENGRLKSLGQEPSRGNWPRNFSISPDGEYLLVAHQYSHNIVSFRRDAQTGLLSFVGEVEAPSPVCIVFPLGK